MNLSVIKDILSQYIFESLNYFFQLVVSDSKKYVSNILSENVNECDRDKENFMV